MAQEVVVLPRVLCRGRGSGVATPLSFTPVTSRTSAQTRSCKLLAGDEPIVVPVKGIEGRISRWHHGRCRRRVSNLSHWYRCCHWSSRSHWHRCCHWSPHSNWRRSRLCNPHCHCHWRRCCHWRRYCLWRRCCDEAPPQMRQAAQQSLAVPQLVPNMRRALQLVPSKLPALQLVPLVAPLPSPWSQMSQMSKLQALQQVQMQLVLNTLAQGPW